MVKTIINIRVKSASKKPIKNWNKTFRLNSKLNQSGFKLVHANPVADYEPDCSINAVAVVTNDGWAETYLDMVAHSIITKSYQMSDTVDAVMKYCTARFAGLYTTRAEYLKIVSDYTDAGKSTETRVYAQDSLINFVKDFAKPDMSYIVVTGVGEPHDIKIFPYGDHITAVIGKTIVDRTNQYINDTVQQFIEIPTKLCENVKFLHKQSWQNVIKAVED